MKPQAPQSASLDTLGDNRRDTALVLEVRFADVNWAEPKDFTIADLKKIYDDGLLMKGGHPNGPGIIFADWQVYRLKKLPSWETLRALFTADAGDGVARKQLIESGFLVRSQ